MIKNQQIKLIHKQIPINLHCILRYKMIKYQQLYQLIENDQFATQFDQLHFMSNFNTFHSIAIQLYFTCISCQISTHFTQLQFNCITCQIYVIK